MISPILAPKVKNAIHMQSIRPLHGKKQLPRFIWIFAVVHDSLECLLVDVKPCGCRFFNHRFVQVSLYFSDLTFRLCVSLRTL